MELGTSLIGIVCVIICALPFVLTSRSKNKKIKKQLITLKDLAKKHSSEITQHDAYSYYAIGLDASKKILSFISKAETSLTKQAVNLETIQSCNVVKISKSKNQKDIDGLYLKLTPTDKNESEILLEFFNADVSYQLGEELQSITKWNLIINEALKMK